MPKGRKAEARRWRTVGLMAVLAVTIIAFLQQPAGSPPARPQAQGDAGAAEAPPMMPDGSLETRDPSATARNESLARQAAQRVSDAYPVQEVEVAVKHDVALIAIIPEPGLTPDEHRRLEEDIAAGMTGKIDGVREVLVSTDPAVHHSVRQLGITQRNVERRVGPRTTESHILWAKEFDQVVRQVEQLGSHARRRLPAAAAGHAPD